MRTWLFLVLLAPIIIAQVMFLDAEPSVITYEFVEDSQLQCKNYTITPVSTPEHDMVHIFWMVCRVHERIVKRNKRSWAKYLLPWNWFGGSSDDVTEKPVIKMTRKEIFRRVGILHKARTAESTSISLEEFSNLTNFDGTPLQWDFHYPDHLLADAWAGMVSKRVRCQDIDSKLSNMILTACGRVNMGRKFSKLRYAVPLASFDKSGSFVKVREMQLLSTEVDGNPMSIEHCRPLETYTECVLKKKPVCSLQNYVNCNTTLLLAPNSTFVRHYGQWSVVAAPVEKYTTMINGTVSSHYMDVSKHVVLRLPSDAYAQFGSVKVYGHAVDNFNHYPFFKPAEQIPFTHEDYDALEEKYGNIPEIAVSRSQLLPKNDNFFRYLYGIVVILAVIGVLAFIMLFCFCKKKGNNHQEVQAEPTVRFAEGVCEIMD